MREQPASSYTFGDSSVAAERLRILAEIFEPSSREFLLTLAPRDPRSVADLGCGPGHTTRLLADIFPNARIMGIDNSPGFVDMASQIGPPNVRFIEGNAAEPPPGGPFDLIYARYLLPHLCDYRSAVLKWADSLSINGSIASEENDWIETTQAAFQTYFEMVAAMLADRGQRLDIGAELEAVDNWLPLVKQSSQSVPIHVPEPIAARMFVPNIDVFRSQPYIQKNYRDAELLQLRSKILGLISDGDHRRVVTFWRRRIVWVRQAI